MLRRKRHEKAVYVRVCDRGHPDKVCDRISDAVLDAVLAVDPNGRVACETCCTTDTVFIAGEITSKVDVNIEGIARRVLRDIGYTGGASGFNADTCKIEVAVHKQSPILRWVQVTM